MLWCRRLIHDSRHATSALPGGIQTKVQEEPCASGENNRRDGAILSENKALRRNDKQRGRTWHSWPSRVKASKIEGSLMQAHVCVVEDRTFLVFTKPIIRCLEHLVGRPWHEM